MKLILALAAAAHAMAPPAAKATPKRMVEGTRLDIKADKTLDIVFKNNREWVSVTRPGALSNSLRGSERVRGGAAGDAHRLLQRLAPQLSLRDV